MVNAVMTSEKMRAILDAVGCSEDCFRVNPADFIAPAFLHAWRHATGEIPKAGEVQKQDPPICAECRHLREDESNTCEHPQTRSLDVVSGIRYFRACRDVRGYKDACGHDGRLFEPKA